MLTNILLVWRGRKYPEVAQHPIIASIDVLLKDVLDFRNKKYGLIKIWLGSKHLL